MVLKIKKKFLRFAQNIIVDVIMWQHLVYGVRPARVESEIENWVPCKNVFASRIKSTWDLDKPTLYH